MVLLRGGKANALTANALNNQFQFIFTEEDRQNFPSIEHENSESMSQINVTPKGFLSFLKYGSKESKLLKTCLDLLNFNAILEFLGQFTQDANIIFSKKVSIILR